MDGLMAYVLSKKHTDSAIREILDAGFKVQVEQDRSIISGTGQQMTLYLIPKESSLSTDTYDEYVYTNKWEQIGSTDIDLNYIVSGIVNQNGTITFTDSDGNTFTTTGASVIGPQGAPGQDYVLTAQDKTDIANIVLGELPTTQGVLYGNASN